MNKNLLIPVALLVTASADLAAQTIPVNVRATYLRTSSDPLAVPAPGIPLSALGSGAGQLLSISTTGAYDNGDGNGDVTRTLVAVFSSSPTLLPDGTLNRVPGAIAAGPTYATQNAYYGNVPTDIPQDFVVGRSSWTNGVQLRVPAGATHVFVATTSAFYGNHTDPNNNFAVVFAAGTAPTLPGTYEHCALFTGVNGTPTASPDIKVAAPFSTISGEIRQRYGVSNGTVFVLAASAFATAGPAPSGPLPGLHLGGGAQLLQISTVTATPGQWSWFVAPGFAGTTLLLQAGFLDPNSRNGLFMSSEAHQIQLQ